MPELGKEYAEYAAVEIELPRSLQIATFMA
jgi:hypothetical protein